MDALVMLGIIPGTSIQISFEAWLAGMVGLGALLGALMIHRSRAVPILLMAFAIRHSLRRATLPLRWA